MAATYEPIASTTLGSDSATVTFSGIPADWTDLILICETGSNNAGTGTHNVNLQLNSDSGTNYSHTALRGDGSSAVSFRTSDSSTPIIGDTTQADASPNKSVVVAQFMSYASTDVYKTILFSSAATRVLRGATLWRSTSAISSISITLSGTSHRSGSTFSLYGIQAA